MTADGWGSDSGPGLYVHVPFCLSKCGYCAFSSTTPTQSLIDAYLGRLEKELCDELAGPSGTGIRTVFVGGGNPTAIGTGHFERLIKLLQEAVSGSSIDEWTIETNPETLTEDTAAVLQGVPGLRLSMGLQRLRDDELALLERRGTCASGREAIRLAFSLTRRVSVDLILGVPGCPSLARDLAGLVSEFPIEHVSAYFLTLEEGTSLEARVRDGRFPDPADVGPEELFEVEETLAKAGFEQYEISNFAQSGGRCRHNMNYWYSGEYIGVGPSAVGTRSGIRRAKPSSLSSWIAGEPDSVELLTTEDRFRETVMLRLRLVGDGLDLDRLAEKFGQLPQAFERAVDLQCQAGLLDRRGSRIILSRQGLPIANRVIAALF